MDSQVPPPPSDGRAAHAGKELWLVRAGSRDELGPCVRAFTGVALDLVLAPPGAAEQFWAAELARASCARVAIDATLGADPSAPEADHAHERAWSAVSRALAEHGRCLAVLDEAAVLALTGRALDLGPLDRRRMRVEPGRAVLLLGGPRGLELRRANVVGPERDPGMPLPGGDGAR